jgi:hypothetical protein
MIPLGGAPIAQHGLNPVWSKLEGHPSISLHRGDSLNQRSSERKRDLWRCGHDLPADLKRALTSDAKALETWEDITPLARNEWICWIESAKKGGNKNSPDRMGLFQTESGNMLLAWLSTSLRSSRSEYIAAVPMSALGHSAT